MANIILTNQCNLSCPYCFAGVIRESEVQIFDKKALEYTFDFLRRSGCREVGLIGGEPALHPHFREILIAATEQFEKVFVYSNGTCLERYFPTALRDNLCYLINVNGASDASSRSFAALEHMLEKAREAGKLSHFSLGVNVFRADQTFEEILSLCRKFDFQALRVSVVVPNSFGEKREEWFRRLKKPLLDLYAQMKRDRIVPKYDCNILPPCLFTEEETAFLESMPGGPEDIARITGGKATCHPVIDIYPDLTAARCFGMSDQRVPLQDFDSLRDLIRCFTFEVDGIRLYQEKSPRCLECYRRRTLQCYGGCLKFQE